MDPFINNPWVVGIVSGIISGLAVFLISSWFISKRRKKEMQQRIQTANNEILHVLRHSFPEKELPPTGIIDSLLSSSARKYEVEKEWLATTKQLADEIIFEIMSNPFLSPTDKSEYCEIVSRMARHEATRTSVTPDHAEAGVFAEKGRRDISIILGIATFCSVLLGFLSTTLGSGTVALNKESLRTALSILAIAIIISTLCLGVVDFYRDIQKLRQVHREAGSVDSGGERTRPDNVS